MILILKNVKEQSFCNTDRVILERKDFFDSRRKGKEKKRSEESLLRWKANIGMSETLFVKGSGVLSSISPEERITMKKGLFAGVGAVAIIGAGYAGLIYYQGMFFDQEAAASLDKFTEKNPNLRLEMKELGRTFDSRSVEVYVYVLPKDPLLELPSPLLRFVGEVKFGLAVKGEFSTDPQAGIFKDFTQEGKELFKDHIVANLNWQGQFEDVHWQVEPIDFTNAKTGDQLKTEEMNLRWNAKSQGSFEIPLISVNGKNQGEVVLTNWSMEADGNKGTMSFDGLKINFQNAVNLDFGPLTSESTLEKRETLDDGITLLTVNGIYELKGLKGAPFISFDSLKGEVHTVNMPDVSYASDEKLLELWKKVLNDGSLKIELPLSISTGDKTSTLKMVIGKQTVDNQPSIGTIDLTFDPASLGTTVASSELRKFIRQQDRKYWRQEGEKFIVRWVLPAYDEIFPESANP